MRKMNDTPSRSPCCGAEIIEVKVHDFVCSDCGELCHNPKKRKWIFGAWLLSSVCIFISYFYFHLLGWTLLWIAIWVLCFIAVKRVDVTPKEEGG